MLLSSHLCLATDGSLARFPVVSIDDASKRITSLSLNPDGLQEIGGMMFKGGVMLCDLPDDVTGVTSSSREDFIRQMLPYAVNVGRSNVCILTGADLNSFCGTFYKIKI